MEKGLKKAKLWRNYLIVLAIAIFLITALYAIRDFGITGQAFMMKCTDHDGMDYYKSSYIELWRPFGAYDQYLYDSCVNGSVVRERFCKNSFWGDAPRAKAFDCYYQDKCQGGRCIITPACIESDGKNIYQKGFVFERIDDGTDDGGITAKKWDYCVGTYAMYEYYCSGDSISAEIITCPSFYECNNGACRYTL